MKIRVRKDKEDKGEFRGLLLSFLLFLAAAAAFGAGSLGFLNSVMPLRAGIRPVWSIWRKITGSRSTMINTMFFMTVLLLISCRRSQ